MAARVGLTGGIGCGKSTVCRLFRELGITTISADEIAHELMTTGTPQYAQIVDHFGVTILDESGAIDRSVLGPRVFNNAAEKTVLESILHPPIRERMLAVAEENGDPYCILEIPLLIETGQYKQMDRVAVITCDVQTRILRLVNDRGMSETAIRKILANQLSDSERAALADDIIDNSGSIDDLRTRVNVLHGLWNKMYSTS